MMMMIIFRSSHRLAALVLILCLVSLAGSATGAQVSVGATAGGAPAPQYDAGKVLWVRTEGDDAAAGTEAQPLRTIPQAVSQARAGTTILVRSGTYSGHVVIPRRLSFIGVAPTRPILDGGGKDKTGFACSTSGIRIHGFEIRNFLEVGISIMQARDVVIEENIIHHIGAGGPTHTTGIRIATPSTATSMCCHRR